MVTAAPLPASTGLENAVNLQELQLNDNGITSLSPLGSLIHLQKLDLSGNPLGGASHILDPLAGLPLTELKLGNCGITDISSLGGIGTLQYLQLYDNSITDISALQSLTGLTYLDLGGNSISNISALGNLTGLTHLVLRGNPIGSFLPISNLSALEYLDLSSTRLEGDISFLSGLNSLQELNLADNFIVVTGPLSGLTLNRLDLSGNCIFNLQPMLSITWTGQYPSITLEHNPDMDESEYMLFREAMSEKHVYCDVIINLQTIYPDDSEPMDQAVGVAGNKISIKYYLYLEGDEAVDYIKRLQLGNYFSKMKVYVNGVYDEALTKSLHFIKDESNPDCLVFSHEPFPDAATITIEAPVRLGWGSIQC